MQMSNDKTLNIIFVLVDIFNENQKKESQIWLNDIVHKLTLDYTDARLFFAFSSAFQYVEYKQLELSQNHIKLLHQLDPNYNILHWDTLILARVILLQHIPNQSFELFSKSFFAIFDTADMHEQVALYNSFYYLNFREKLASKFALGISSNISTVFDALTIHNAYPVQYLSENAWNQMVIKTIFNDKNISNIIGIKTRLNADLSKMAIDLKAERLAANRFINPQIELLIGH